MSIPKRQHWVPQFYLRYFATPRSACSSEQVWIFQRKHGAPPQLTNISNIAAEKYLYSPQDSSGDRDAAVEAKLGKLESMMARVWPRLASGFVDLSSTPMRRAIALFLSVQFLRHPERLDSITGFRHRVLSLIEAHTGNAAPIKLQIGNQLIRVDNELQNEIFTSDRNDDQRTWTHFIKTEAIRYAEMLMEKRWSIVCIDEPLFVTSDYPLFVASTEHAKHQIGGSGAVIMFPISPTRVLCLDDLDAIPNQYYKLTADEARLYNMLTWVNTHRFMISPREIYDVLAEIVDLQEEYQQELKDNQSPPI